MDVAIDSYVATNKRLLAATLQRFVMKLLCHSGLRTRNSSCNPQGFVQKPQVDDRVICMKKVAANSLLFVAA